MHFQEVMQDIKSVEVSSFQPVCHSACGAWLCDETVAKSRTKRKFLKWQRGGQALISHLSLSILCSALIRTFSWTEKDLCRLPVVTELNIAFWCTGPRQDRSMPVCSADHLHIILQESCLNNRSFVVLTKWWNNNLSAFLSERNQKTRIWNINCWLISTLSLVTEAPHLPQAIKVVMDFSARTAHKRFWPWKCRTPKAIKIFIGSLRLQSTL